MQDKIENPDRREALKQFSIDHIPETSQKVGTCIVCTLNIEELDFMITNYTPCLSVEPGDAHKHFMSFFHIHILNDQERDNSKCWPKAGDKNRQFPITKFTEKQS